MPAKLCRLRFAALDRNMTLDASAGAEQPSAPAASSHSLATPVTESAASEQGRIGEAKLGEATVKLALLPEAILHELAAAFDEQTASINPNNEDTKVDDLPGGSSKSDTTSRAVRGAAVTGESAGPAGADGSPAGERSELRQVLDFLENHVNERGGGDSFEELFGIPETMLDRSVAVADESSTSAQSPDVKPKSADEENDLFIDRGHFDLSDPRFAETFDRVAKAIGAYD